MIESLKEAVCLVFLESYSSIHYLDDGMLVIPSDADGDVAAIKCIFHGIRQQVADHLIEVDAVYPYFQRLSFQIVFFLQVEADTSLVGIEGEEGGDALDKLLQLGRLTVKAHLVLVNLALVQDLVYQEKQALRIAVDGVQVLLALCICQASFQLVERSHDECQR